MPPKCLKNIEKMSENCPNRWTAQQKGMPPKCPKNVRKNVRNLSKNCPIFGPIWSMLLFRDPVQCWPVTTLLETNTKHKEEKQMEIVSRPQVPGKQRGEQRLQDRLCCNKSLFCKQGAQAICLWLHTGRHSQLHGVVADVSVVALSMRSSLLQWSWARQTDQGDSEGWWVFIRNWCWDTNF